MFDDEVEKGANSVHYTKVVEWLTKELGDFYGLDDKVNAVSGNHSFLSIKGV